MTNRVVVNYCTEVRIPMRTMNYLRWTTLITLGLMLISVSSTNSQAATATDLIKDLIDFEIGKTGSCANYVSSVIHPTHRYDGKDRLLTSRKIGTATVSEVKAEQKATLDEYQSTALLPNGQIIPSYTYPRESSQLYHITYRSTATDGQPAILSGLVVIPSGSLANGIVVYDHATQVSRNNGAPSHPSHEACIVITALTGKERVLAMPDYLGYGDNLDAHPYPLGIQNAPAGIDIIIAARELAENEQKGHPIGSSLAITGYSEGGGNALWLARLIAEKAPDLKGSQLSMIAPMSGNYDMTGAMAHSLLVDQPAPSYLDTNSLLTFYSKPMLASFAAQGAANNSSSSLASMMQGSFLDLTTKSPLPIPQIDLAAYALKLMTDVKLTGYTFAHPNPSILMTAQFAAALSTTDLTNPAVFLWKQNDNTTWIPLGAGGRPIPAYVTGILQDQIVPFAGSQYPVPAGYVGGSPFFAAGNGENLIGSLRKLGVSSSSLAWCGIDARMIPKDSPTSSKMVMINHVNGLPPVMALAARAIEGDSLQNVPTIPDP